MGFVNTYSMISEGESEAVPEVSVCKTPASHTDGCRYQYSDWFVFKNSIFIYIRVGLWQS